MNDRFRFRVWDNSNEIWLEDEDLSIAPNGTLTVLGLDSDGETIFCEDEDCIVEQCTGLKDKNGKLIYEGDIVQLTRERRWLPKGSLHIIEWRTFNCCGFCLGSLGSLTEKCSKECIVIGNIHENPELLKEKK